MSIRMIASIVIAALLMTGGAAAASSQEYAGQADAPQQLREVLPETKELTAEEAKAIALSHAGLKEEEVTGLVTKYDKDDGVTEWEVDFRKGDYEYDYDIDAKTGKILKSEKEKDPVKVPAPTQAPTEPAAPKTLTAEEAKAIALAHAGLKEADVTGLVTKYDIDDGVPEWEVDFRKGDYEYDYEIHAETGKILKSEKEKEPVKAPAKETKPAETKPAATEKISAAKAKSIALAHAGLKESQVKGLRAEYDVDDGVPQWEVEFRVGNMEYEYEIHAKTGKIRSWDKDRDD